VSDYVYEVTSIAATDGPTPWQTVGPFFHFALPYELGPAVVGTARPGAFVLNGHVYDGEGTPLPDALVEIWQADESGSFAADPGIFDDPSPDGFRGFGRSATDAEGHYTFSTVKPAGVRTAEGATQAPHVAMSVFARGMLRRVVTRVYFEDEPGNVDDPLLGSIPASRAATLVATCAEGGYRFDVRLQGADETVFLDVSTH
jgi:protocatechuate 3,4-dioxygenase alpha subunit